MSERSPDQIVHTFKRRFGRVPEWVVAAPGRVNLIGEHTDYNEGFVLPMAIERHTIIAAARRDDDAEPSVNAYSVNLDEQDSFEIKRLRSEGRWTDYIKGVIAEFLERGLTASSLDLVVSSNVPMGCGLSSSAALQIATARLLQQLNADLVKDDEIAELCQAAEHKFAGVPVGIMDPYCIANAREKHAVFLDCRTLQAMHIPFDDPDVVALIVDSKVSRKLRSGAYAERRSQCEEACRILGVGKLRDTTIEMVEASRNALGDVCYRRARHVTTENVRTRSAVAAIGHKDWKLFGELMYQSHESLMMDFDVSCPEIDTLVDLMKQMGIAGGVFGARMTGGGFGGCMVALVQRTKADQIIEQLTAGYRAATGTELSAYVSSPASGARVLGQAELESS